MRPLLVVPVLLLALAPLASGATGGGNGLGVQVGDAYSVGMWDIWRVYVTQAGTLTANLSWVASPGGADYDLTLWKPGADLDGVLAQSEMLQASWNRSVTHPERLSYPVAPDAKAYVVTVEAASAKLETYRLAVEGGRLVRTCHTLSPPATCLWSAQGVKCLDPDLCVLRRG